MNIVLTVLVCVVGVIIPGILALLLLGNPLLSMMIAAFAFLIEIPCIYLAVFIWPQKRELKRRLDRVAATLKGETSTDTTTGGSVSIFREQRSQSRLIERLEHQFPMIEVRKVLPKAVGLGVLGALAVGLGAVFMGFGTLVILFFLLVSVPGGSWAGAGHAGHRPAQRVYQDLSRDHRPGGTPGAGRCSGNGGHFDCGSGSSAAGWRGHARSRLGDDGRTGPGNRNQQRRGARPHSRFLPLLCRNLLAVDDRGWHFRRARQSFGYPARPPRCFTQGQEFDGPDPADPGIISLVPVAVLVTQNFTNPQTIETLFYTESGSTLLRYGVGLILSGLLVARALSARVGR